MEISFYTIDIIMRPVIIWNFLVPFNFSLSILLKLGITHLYGLDSKSQTFKYFFANVVLPIAVYPKIKIPLFLFNVIA